MLLRSIADLAIIWLAQPPSSARYSQPCHEVRVPWTADWEHIKACPPTCYRNSSSVVLPLLLHAFNWNQLFQQCRTVLLLLSSAYSSSIFSSKNPAQIRSHKEIWLQSRR